MPAIEVFKNNITTTLAIGINSSDTTITVVTGSGSNFPSLSGGNYFRAVLTSSAVPGSSYEYIIVTAVTGDNLTVIRGQEGSTAASWNAGDILYMTATAASMGTFAQGVDLTGYAPLNSPNFTGTPAAPTPPQFDADASLATSEFVQRALGNYSGYDIISTTTVLTAANIGHILGISASVLITLPVGATVAIGSTLTLVVGSGTPTLTVQGSDALWGACTNILTTPLLLNSRETIDVTYLGGGIWSVVRSAWNLPQARQASVVNPGYQIMPSGLIIQWGSFGGNNIVPNTQYTTNFPISYPNNQLTTLLSSTRSDFFSVQYFTRAAGGYNPLTQFAWAGNQTCQSAGYYVSFGY